MPSYLLDLLDRPGRCVGSRPQDLEGEGGGGGGPLCLVISIRDRRCSRSAERPARAGAAAAGRRLRFSGIVVWQNSGRRWSSADRAPMLHVGFAWSGGGGWCRRRSSAAGPTGSSATIAKFCSTYVGGCLSSLAPGASLNDQRNLAGLTMLSALTRARARLGGAMPSYLLDLLDRPGRCVGSRPQDSKVRVAGGGVASSF